MATRLCSLCAGSGRCERSEPRRGLAKVLGPRLITEPCDACKGTGSITLSSPPPPPPPLNVPLREAIETVKYYTVRPGTPTSIDEALSAVGILLQSGDHPDAIDALIQGAAETRGARKEVVEACRDALRRKGSAAYSRVVKHFVEKVPLYLKAVSAGQQELAEVLASGASKTDVEQLRGRFHSWRVDNSEIVAIAHVFLHFGIYVGVTVRLLGVLSQQSDFRGRNRNTEAASYLAHLVREHASQLPSTDLNAIVTFRFDEVTDESLSENHEDWVRHDIDLRPIKRSALNELSRRG